MKNTVMDWVSGTGDVARYSNWVWKITIVVFSLPMLLAYLSLYVYERIRGEQWE